MSRGPYDVTAVRLDFPMLQQRMHGKTLIYLDTAATAQKPNNVIDAEGNFYRSHYGTVNRAIYELAMQATDQYQKVRGKVRRFLNAAREEEIIFTRGTTDAINLVAASFGKAFIKVGDEVLISQIEHHSNIVPWQLMCQERGAILKVIPVLETGDLDLEAYTKLLSPKTKLVAVGHVANSIGTRNPIKIMAAMAHNAGAKILVDGAQAAPQIPVDVQDLDVDFYAFSGHKAYGPTGIGILYGRASLLDAMPPYQGGGDMIEVVSFEGTTFNTLPHKFEAGTPMITQAMGLGAALDYLETIGIENIFAHEAELLAYATEQLSRISDVRIVGTAKEKGAILSFILGKAHPLDVGTLLSLHGIALRSGLLCAHPTMRCFGLPNGIVRASFGLYNTREEIDTFIVAVDQVRAKLR